MPDGADVKPLSRTAGEGGSPGRARRVRVLAPRQTIDPPPPPSPPPGGERGFFGVLRRRVFLAGIAAALMPRPLLAYGPPRSGMRRLGVLMGLLASDPGGQARAAALVRGLGALNWNEGGNL